MLSAVLNIFALGYGFDIFSPVSATQWQCLAKTANITWVAPNVYLHSGLLPGAGLRPWAKENVDTANAAGFDKVDVWMTACRGSSATAQVQAVVNALEGSEYSTIFLALGSGYSVDINASHFDLDCGWVTNRTSKAANCLHLQEWVGAVMESGKEAGIWVDEIFWEKAISDDCELPDETKYWWPHYDLKHDDCSGFKPFGPFKKPYLKMFIANWYTKDITSCNIPNCTSDRVASNSTCDTDILC